MKKILLLIISISCSQLIADNMCYNPIEMAILKSDPTALKEELDALNTQSKQLGKREQIKYLALSNEILTRRRTIIECPYSPYIYMDRYLPHDKRPTLMPWLKIIGSIYGSVSLWFFGLACAPEKNETLQSVYCAGLVTATLPFLYIFCNGVNDLEKDSKKPNILYERALNVRQMLYDVQEV